MPKIKEVNEASGDTPFTIKVATGGEKTVLRKNIVGFCKYPFHRGWLTKNVASTHNCYGKCCSSLVKVDSPYWTEKERAEKELIAKKEQERAEKALMKELPLNERILMFAKREAERFELDLLLQGISMKNDKQCTLYYLSNHLYEDQGMYSKICSTVYKKFGVLCVLRKINLVGQVEEMHQTARRMEEEGKFTSEEVQERKFDLPNPEDYTYLNLLSNLQTKTFVKKNMVVGFCNKPKHRGWIVKKEADKHQCKERRCPYLRRLNHPYWGRPLSEDILTLDYQQAAAEQSEIQSKIIEEVKKQFNKISSDTSIEAQLIRVQYLWDEYKYYQIEYISELEQDDRTTFSDICDVIYKKFHVCCVLKKLTEIPADMTSAEEDSYAHQTPVNTSEEGLAAPELPETAPEEKVSVSEPTPSVTETPSETMAQSRLEKVPTENKPADQKKEEKENTSQKQITRILVILAILLVIAYFVLYTAGSNL